MIRKVQVIVYIRKPLPLILLLRRPPDRGHIWQPVTGKIEPEDENYLQAGRREVLEETGITDAVRMIDPEIEFHFEADGKKMAERLVGIELESPRPITLSNEHVEYAWLEPSEALSRIYWETNADGMRKVLSHAGIDV
jgi:8-oxo-dGTP pyrophosphatase MutT (NUDIX family)